MFIMKQACTITQSKKEKIMTKEKHSFKPPQLPPVPNPVNPPPTADNWLWRHHDVNNGVNNHENKPDEFDPIPPPQTENVTPENPLLVDVCDSIRSPYSYLVINRLAYLQSNYNCKVNLRIIFPGAVRMPDVAGGAVDDTGNAIDHEPEHKTNYKQGGRWYKWADCVWDCYRVAEFQGVPWKFAHPDPIDQNHYPFLGLDYGAVQTIDNQTWISWMVRLANAAELEGKSMAFMLFVGPLIWGGMSEFWPADIPEAWNKLKTPKNYDETIADIQENPEKYDAVWQKSQPIQIQSGHGGVPNMIFRGEPFFGQDRFDHLFFRLRQNGLTMREEPVWPVVTKPIRWPDGI
jgi:2-hydroxychromene-2-carboxylate isomerase